MTNLKTNPGFTSIAYLAGMLVVSILNKYEPSVLKSRKKSVSVDSSQLLHHTTFRHLLGIATETPNLKSKQSLFERTARLIARVDLGQ